MKINHILMLVAVAAITGGLSTEVFGSGSSSGALLEKKLATALGKKEAVCTGDSDQVTLSVDSKGLIRMVAHYKGSISGTLDTDDEKDGAECGGLFVHISKAKKNYVLDDRYDDCERGSWSYRIFLPENALELLAKKNEFDINSYPVVEGSKDAIRRLSCKVN